jgi:TatD DNase family protein
MAYGGFRFGIGGVVTFKNATLPEVLKNIPLKHILLETDAPYLAPMPYRGKRNESAYLSYIADKLSDIYECPVAQVKSVTTKNAEELFQLSKYLII